MLSWVGVVWDIREVPERVLEEGRRRDRALSTTGTIRPAVRARN
jgi:hypothetical protein